MVVFVFFMGTDCGRIRRELDLSEVPYPFVRNKVHKDVGIFTDVLVHNVTGHGKGAVPTQSCHSLLLELKRFAVLARRR